LPSRPLALAAIGLAYSVVALDTVMITGVAPTIAGSLQGLALVGWLFTAYLVTWTVTLPLYGKLADLYGRRPVVLLGAGVFIAGSLLAALAQSMEQLVACRLVQGIGIGAIQPVTQTAAGDLYPPHQRARAQLLFSIVFFVSSIVGPLLAEFLVLTLHWRAVFLVEAGVAALGIPCVILLVRDAPGRRQQPADTSHAPGGAPGAGAPPKSPATRGTGDVAPRPLSSRVDWLGALLLIVGAGAALIAIAQASRGGGWTMPLQLALYATAAVALPLFVWQETRAPEPLVPLGLLRRRVILGSYLIMLVVGGMVVAWQPFVPLFVQGVLELGPAAAGLLALPYNGAWMLTNALAPTLFWRWGYRVTCMLGLVIMALGYLLLLVPDRSLAVAYPICLLALFVFGAGVGFANTASAVAVQNAVPWHQRGVGTSGHQFCRFLGASVLVALAATLVNGRLGDELAARGVDAAPLGASGEAVSRVAQASALLTPDTRAALPPAVLAAMQAALEVTLRDAYLFIAGAAIVGLLLALLIPGGRAETHVWREDER
jgi:MFS family permease